MHEWATSGAERRNTAAYGHAISLGACRTVLGVGVDKAGSISWRSCTRRLVDLAARRLVGPSAHRPPAQWQRPRKWICARAPHRATKLSWGSDAQAELRRIPAFLSVEVSFKKSYSKKNRPRPGVSTRHLVVMGSIPNWVTTSAKRTLRCRVKFPERLAHA